MLKNNQSTTLNFTIEHNNKTKTNKIANSLIEIKKSLVKKLKPIEYKNTDLNPGFIELEEEYKNVRTALKEFKDCLKTFKNYEYGHNSLKKVYDGFKFVEKKTELKLIEQKDLYSLLSSAGYEISKYTTNETRKELALNFKNAYASIKENKDEFNWEVKQLIMSIDVLLQIVNEINKKRKNIRNSRYELELLIVDENYDNELVKENRKLLSAKCKEVMKDMSEFIKDKSLGKIIRKFQKLHCKFFNQMCDELDGIANC